MAVVDWSRLRTAAISASANAYCPYSSLAIGAAGLTGDGRVVTGCNIENASFGLTLCAECALVGDVFRSGAKSLIAVSIVNSDDEFMWPCGRCRQLLWEVGGPDLLLDSDTAPVRLAELLPHAFGREHLPAL